jgi:tRNA pseudouridine65 synthase
MFVHRTGLAEPGALFALQILRKQMKRQVNPVHRIDRPTEGIVLFAFEKECTRLLCEAFAERRIKKEYLALVRGWIDEEGIIDYPLADLDSGTKHDAVTEFRRLATIELPIPVRPYDTSRYSLVKLYPQTGRQHQLRRHLKHVFHPIIGDTRYGDGHHNESIRLNYKGRRMYLFSRSIYLDHPYSKEKLHIQAPLPADVLELFHGWSWQL